MSPEQAQGARVDGRTDVYGLAAVCYRCLTGRSPFSARDTPALLYKVVHEMPIDPRQLGRVHDEIAAVLAIGMAKDLRDRFESSEELAAALALALRGRLSGALATRAAALLARHPWRHPL
jgi:serine/threonine-protein kinase